MEGEGPFDTTIDPDLAARFAAATGGAPPALALLARTFAVQEQARPALVPAAIQASATGGVHGEHDLVLHRPFEVGEPLLTTVALHGVGPAGRNAAVTLRYTTSDADGGVVAEQWWTTVFLGTTAAVEGEAPPGHRFPDEARARPLRTHAIEVDADVARRYAEASGDWSPHHFDVEAARASGADRPFLHGLCTMALAGAAVAAGQELRRLAVRLAAPMPLGERLEVATYDAGDGAVAFDATAAGSMVLAHGRAELAR